MAESIDIAQFRRHILDLSVEVTNYSVAILEWETPKPYENNTASGHCICGKTGIKRMYRMQHRTKEWTFVDIGCDCAERVMAEMLKTQCKYCEGGLTYERRCADKDMCGKCERRARNLNMACKLLYTSHHTPYNTYYKTKNTEYVVNRFTSRQSNPSFPFVDLLPYLKYSGSSFHVIGQSIPLCNLIIENEASGKYNTLPDDEYNLVKDLLLFIEVTHFH
jgi:hypothetical protein